MKAAQITGYGGAEVMQVVEGAPNPVVGAGQVLVAVHAAAVNPFDWKVREGMVRQMAELQFPAILGGDFAGVVAEVGEGVTSVSVGDEVYGLANALGSHGSFAECTAVQAESVGAKPSSVDFATAAAMPLAGVSAYQALVDHAALQSGQKVLIHGGAGGIGTFAIQLAKHLGAYVAATAATEDVDFVKELGADEVIDYKTQDFATIIRDYDVVYDNVGGETFTKSHAVLKPGGVVITMAAQPDEALMAQYNVKAIGQFTQVNTERLAKLTELIDAGIITVHVDKTFPLEQVAEALDYIKQGQHRGKVVLSISA
jgi:NADPH:quinone reductase-like Zn-dependent oxidoreductase